MQFTMLLKKNTINNGTYIDYNTCNTCDEGCMKLEKERKKEKVLVLVKLTINLKS